MITEIWIDNKRLDLYDDTSIKHTKQVNDVGEIKDRQASYTNNFSIPKTPNNVQIFLGLGIPSDTSRFPYSKPDCKMKIEGFDLIIKGWMNVTETKDDYQCYVYSGIINFFKAIENKKFGDIDISELDHEKNLANVISSFSNNTYKYLIANYYGKTHYDGNKINIDYIIPSVKVSYLWNKIHSVFGFPFEGSVFDTEQFTNLWMTYPKAPLAGDLLKEVASIHFTRTQAQRVFPGFWVEDQYHFYVSDSNQITEGEFIPYGQSYNNIEPNLMGKYRFASGGRYKISIKGNLEVRVAPPGETPRQTYLIKNCDGCNVKDAINNGLLIHSVNIPSGEVIYSIDIDNRFFDFNAGDVINLGFFSAIGQTLNAGDVTLTIEKEVSPYVSFSQELKEFYIKDFVKEILVQLGLTQFTEELSNNLDYKTVSERLSTAKVIDWTDKYIERTNESYVFESYAQENIFAYQYNDKESTYNNGSLKVGNVNLEDRKTVWTSKMFSPESQLATFRIGIKKELTNPFKIYDREASEDGIYYKALEKRFFFVREKVISETVTIGSETLATEQTVAAIPFATFEGLSWDELLLKNYSDFKFLLNQSKKHNITLNLDLIDIIQLDLGAKYYFAQEQQNYIINKLNFDDNNASGEFVMVREYASSLYPLLISWNSGTSEDRSGDLSTEKVKISKRSYPVDDPTTILEWQVQNGGDWIGLGDSISPKDIALGFGINLIRIKASLNDNDYYSNELRYTKEGVNIYITDFVYDWDLGTSSYKLHVENQNFVGYANMRAFKQPNGRNARVTGNSFGGTLTISNAVPALEEVYKSTAVNIPVGVYNCNMDCSIIPIDLYEYTGLDGYLSFGLSPEYGVDSLVEIGVRLDLPGTT